MNLGQAFRHCARRCNRKPFKRVNLCFILKELDNSKDKDINAEKEMLTSKIRREAKRFENEIRKLKEKYDVEAIMVEIMEQLLNALNINYEKSLKVTANQTKRVNSNHSKKINYLEQMLRSKEKYFRLFQERSEKRKIENQKEVIRLKEKFLHKIQKECREMTKDFKS